MAATLMLAAAGRTAAAAAWMKAAAVPQLMAARASVVAIKDTEKRPTLTTDQVVAAIHSAGQERTSHRPARPSRGYAGPYAAPIDVSKDKYIVAQLDDLRKSHRELHARMSVPGALAQLVCATLPPDGAWDVRSLKQRAIDEWHRVLRDTPRHVPAAAAGFTTTAAAAFLVQHVPGDRKGVGGAHPRTRAIHDDIAKIPDLARPEDRAEAQLVVDMCAAIKALPPY